MAGTRCLHKMSLQIIALCFGNIHPIDRALSIIPPDFVAVDIRNGSSVRLGNQFAIRVLQSEVSTGAAPQGLTVVNIHTTIQDPLAAQDCRLAGWAHRAASLHGTAQQLSARIRRVVLLNMPDAPLIIKFTSILRPLTEPALLSATIATTGSLDAASVHMEGEVAQTERIMQHLFQIDTLFTAEETAQYSGENGGGAEEDDEMHLLEQAYSMANASLRNDTTN